MVPGEIPANQVPRPGARGHQEGPQPGPGHGHVHVEDPLGIAHGLFAGGEDENRQDRSDHQAGYAAPAAIRHHPRIDPSFP